MTLATTIEHQHCVICYLEGHDFSVCKRRQPHNMMHGQTDHRMKELKTIKFSGDQNLCYTCWLPLTDTLHEKDANPLQRRCKYSDIVRPVIARALIDTPKQLALVLGVQTNMSTPELIETLKAELADYRDASLGIHKAFLAIFEAMRKNHRWV